MSRAFKRFFGKKLQFWFWNLTELYQKVHSWHYTGPSARHQWQPTRVFPDRVLCPDRPLWPGGNHGGHGPSHRPGRPWNQELQGDLPHDHRRRTGLPDPLRGRGRDGGGENGVRPGMRPEETHGIRIRRPVPGVRQGSQLPMLDDHRSQRFRWPHTLNRLFFVRFEGNSILLRTQFFPFETRFFWLIYANSIIKNLIPAKNCVGWPFFIYKLLENSCFQRNILH